MKFNLVTMANSESDYLRAMCDVNVGETRVELESGQIETPAHKMERRFIKKFRLVWFYTFGTMCLIMALTSIFAVVSIQMSKTSATTVELFEAKRNGDYALYKANLEFMKDDYKRLIDSTIMNEYKKIDDFVVKMQVELLETISSAARDSFSLKTYIRDLTASTLDKLQVAFDAIVAQKRSDFASNEQLYQELMHTLFLARNGIEEMRGKIKSETYLKDLKDLEQKYDELMRKIDSMMVKTSTSVSEQITSVISVPVTEASVPVT